MDLRFGIENRFKPVSFEQFQDTALRLRDSISRIRPSSTSELFLTTNYGDYIGAGSLSIVTDETLAAADRRERHSLDDLSVDMWATSYETQLRILDSSDDARYFIWLSNEQRDPKRLLFHGNGLDSLSMNIVSRFKDERWAPNALAKYLQKIDDGYHKTSPAMIAHARGYFGK